MTTVAPFCSTPSFATEISVPHQHVYLEIKTRYGVQWTKIFKDGKVWACQSDILPYFESKKDPLAGLSWNEIKSLAGKPDPSCENQITLIDQRGKTTERIKGCMGNPKLDQWIASVHDHCGRR
jgi:hypothetical protein